MLINSAYVCEQNNYGEAATELLVLTGRANQAGLGDCQLIDTYANFSLWEHFSSAKDH